MKLYVIETEDNQYLGEIGWAEGSLTVKNGFRGHPVKVPVDEVVQITLATDHPMVEI